MKMISGTSLRRKSTCVCTYELDCNLHEYGDCMMRGQRGNGAEKDGYRVCESLNNIKKVKRKKANRIANGDKSSDSFQICFSEVG